MLRYAALGSGSSANAYIFEFGDFSFLVDNGFSCRELIRRAENLGFDTGKIQYIFLTHIHSDHLKGVELLSRKLKVPVVSHRSLNLLRYTSGALAGQVKIEPGESLSLGPLSIRAFSTSHDAPFSLSYSFCLGEKQFSLITDTGLVSREMYDLARDSHVLFLESNYCPSKLEEGPYPQFLKARIKSSQGHLSNAAALKFLNTLAEDEASRLSRVFFCHLSGTNNDPVYLEDYMEEHLRWKGRFVVCPKGVPVFGDD